MRSRRLLLLLVSLALLGVLPAEETTGASSEEPLAAAQDHLRTLAGLFGWPQDLGDLRPIETRKSLSGDHTRFQQTVDSLPVFGAYVTVSLPKETSGQPFVLSRYLPRTGPVDREVRLDGAEAVTRVEQLLTVSDGDLRGPVAVEAVFFAEEGRLVRSWQVVVPTTEPLGTWLIVLRADSGALLLRQNLLRFDSGRVFNPNPAKTSGGAIPPPADCDSAPNESLLAGQYQTKTLLGITPAQNQLRGQFVDLTAPGIIGGYKPAGQAIDSGHNYIYSCSDDRFEEVMTYYHVDTVQRKIQSLGFVGATGILDQPIAAHAHYFSDCNAFYDPTSDGIHFGDSDDGGCSPKTDVAEDADVIVHEYGHAIQDDQIPAFGFGTASQTEQAAAMGEGFGDFLSSAIFGDPCLGEWVNFGTTACAGSEGLRTLDNSKHYPEDFEACRPAPPFVAEPHCAGLIWGGALWDLVESLGNDLAARDLVLTLVLESHFFIDPLSTFAEDAAAIRLADSLLYQGSHIVTIDTVFSARGISDTGPISDFPYAYLRIDHTYRGDLDVDLLVGSISSPVCTLAVYGPNPGDGGDDLVGYEPLVGSVCETFLPPTLTQPWYLRVRDVAALDVGRIEEFEIVLPSADRCIATDVPINIPDNDGFVYSAVDCSTVAGPYPASDLDGDGFNNAVELHLGTGVLHPCGNNGWPADLDPDNNLNIGDLNSFVFPTRTIDDGHGFFNKFGHPVPDSDPNIHRWDLDGNNAVDIGDINALNPAVAADTARPPMLGGQPAFAKTCPFTP